MSRFAEKYTQRQRDAVAEAVVDRRMKARAVAELAAAGDLHDSLGNRLDAFEVPESTVREQARKLRKRRAGEGVTPLAEKPHRDAIEALRRRLVSVADLELAHFERTVRRTPEKADPERLRQIIRCVREAAALPDRDDARPPAPGMGRERVGGDTRGGMAGAILAAAGLGRDGGGEGG